MNEKQLDIGNFLVKFLGLIIAGFGVWSYFDNSSIESKKEQKAASLEYIREYGSSHLQEHRLVLFRFWTAHGEIFQMHKKYGASSRSMTNFYITALNEYEEADAFINALTSLSFFYNSVNSCYEAEICDKTLIVDYFCDKFQAFYSAHVELISLLSSNSGYKSINIPPRGLPHDC